MHERSGRKWRTCIGGETQINEIALTISNDIKNLLGLIIPNRGLLVYWANTEPKKYIWLQIWPTKYESYVTKIISLERAFKYRFNGIIFVTYNSWFIDKFYGQTFFLNFVLAQ